MTAFAANGVRGEVTAVLAGEPRRLCLTLGALAEIETALGIDNPAQLGERLRDPGARDILAMLQALLRGGGEDAFASALPAQPVEATEAAAAVAAAFLAATGAP